MSHSKARDSCHMFDFRVQGVTISLVSFLEVVCAPIIATLIVVVPFFELLLPLVLPLDEILQVSLAYEVLILLLEMDAFFDIMNMVLVVVVIFAHISLECTFLHL